MGKIKQGILGGFKGKVGTVIGSSWNGIHYMRGIAQSTKKSNTSAQQTQRNFFKQVVDVAGQLTDEQLKFLFPKNVSKMTRRNLFVQQLAEFSVTVGDVKSIDWTRQASFGNADTAELPDAAASDEGGNMKITWDANQAQGFGDEYPTFMVINQTQNKVFLVNSDTTFSTGAFQLTGFPYGDASDSYSVVTYATGSKIRLIGFGTMSVTKRKPR